MAKAIAICADQGLRGLPPVEVVAADQFPDADLHHASAFRRVTDGRLDPTIYVIRTSWEYQHGDSPFANILLAAVLVHEWQHGRDFVAGVREPRATERSALAAEIAFLTHVALAALPSWRGALHERIVVRSAYLKALTP